MFEIPPPNKVTFELDKEKENKARLEIEPCYPGFGMTIGNALRRVLLSSLPGAAISAVKIDGVDHEFSAIENVKEDVVEILLNLKMVRMKMHAEEPIRLKLSSSGKKTFTAADFEKNDSVEIVNPGQIIATGTSDSSKMEMEVIIETGKGYIPVEQKEKKDLEIGMISVDSVFSPIQTVSLNVTNARVGRMTNFDKINMELQTDGTISPEDAIKIAGKILVEQFVPLAADLIGKEELEQRLATPAHEELQAAEGEVSEIEDSAEGEGQDLDMPIEELNFSTRTINALHSNDIKTLKDIVSRNKEELESLQGLGGKALSEIQKNLKEHGFDLA